MIEMGIGVPFSKLAMVFFTLLFPRGVLEMLVSGGSAYPLYIFLSCLFTALCAAVGNVSFRRKQLR